MTETPFHPANPDADRLPTEAEAEHDRFTLLVEALADCEGEWAHCPVCNYAEPHANGHDSECILGAALAAGSSANPEESEA